MHEKCTFPRAQKAVGRDRVKRKFRADHLMDVKAAQKSDFADRLKAAIERKGWSMSETARRASTFLNEGEKFGRAHVWHYVQGRALPRFRYLEALSLALNVRPDELMPVESDTEHDLR